MAITLLQLRTQARQRSDQESSEFISDSELNSYINNSVAELHDILVQSYGSDYFLSEYLFSTVVDTDAYALPADFYKVVGVDLKLNAKDYCTIKKFTFNERNNVGEWNSINSNSVRYRIMGANIRFSPIPDAVTDARLWYVPVATVLVADGDQLLDYNAYAEYVIVDAAIKMLAKEESDVSVLMAQKQGLKRRIEEAANNRDAANPESVKDIYADNIDYFFGRSRN